MNARMTRVLQVMVVAGLALSATGFRCAVGYSYSAPSRYNYVQVEYVEPRPDVEYVTVEPPPPRHEPVPPRPSPTHVWVNGVWVYRGGTWVWSSGCWTSTPAPRTYWQPGYWERHGRHYHWVPGQWRSY